MRGSFLATEHQFPEIVIFVQEALDLTHQPNRYLHEQANELDSLILYC